MHIPDELSPEARNLIESLLVKPEKRLEYPDIVKHPFFKLVDWNNIASSNGLFSCKYLLLLLFIYLFIVSPVAPPFVPVIKGPTDTSNFDSFDPVDDSADTNTTHKSSRSFTGRNLPFIGFSYTNWSSYHTGGDTHHNTGYMHILFIYLFICLFVCCCVSEPDDVHVALKRCREELRAADEEKKSIKQESDIYKKQMMVMEYYIINIIIFIIIVVVVVVVVFRICIVGLSRSVKKEERPIPKHCSCWLKLEKVIK